jgi:hypothetical protein
LRQRREPLRQAREPRVADRRQFVARRPLQQLARGLQMRQQRAEELDALSSMSTQAKRIVAPNSPRSVSYTGR